MTSPTLGIDVGGTAIKWSVLQDDIVLDSGSLPTPRSSAGEVIDAMAELVHRQPNIATVGVAFPGLVDTATRETVFLPNLPGDWVNRSVAEELEQKTRTHVRLMNDARAFAYAELNLGAARDDSDVLFVTLGTGVGGAIAIGGQLIIGSIDAVGEVGHTIVEPGGDLCGCGGRGCLETVASASAIVARATRSQLMALSPALASADPISAADVAAGARSGDPWCLDVFERAGRGIGLAAGNVAALLRIRTVIVGGGLATAFDLMQEATDTALTERRTLIGPIAVREAALGPTAGSIGAALYALHNS